MEGLDDPERRCLSFTAVSASGYDLIADDACRVLFTSRSVVIASQRLSARSEILVDDILAIEIGGPGAVTSGGGFIGGGFGTKGFVEGAVLAGALNSLTTTTTVDTLLEIRTRTGQAMLHTSSRTPQGLRVVLAPLIARVDRATTSTVTPSGTTADLPSGTNLVEDLERLAALLDRGTLSPAEFETAKARLLRSQPEPDPDQREGADPDRDAPRPPEVPLAPPTERELDQPSSAADPPALVSGRELPEAFGSNLLVEGGLLLEECLLVSPAQGPLITGQAYDLWFDDSALDISAPGHNEPLVMVSYDRLADVRVEPGGATRSVTGGAAVGAHSGKWTAIHLAIDGRELIFAERSLRPADLASLLAPVQHLLSGSERRSSPTVASGDGSRADEPPAPTSPPAPRRVLVQTTCLLLGWLLVTDFVFFVPRLVFFVALLGVLTATAVRLRPLDVRRVVAIYAFALSAWALDFGLLIPLADRVYGYAASFFVDGVLPLLAYAGAATVALAGVGITDPGSRTRMRQSLTAGNAVHRARAAALGLVLLITAITFVVRAVNAPLTFGLYHRYVAPVGLVTGPQVESYLMAHLRDTYGQSFSSVSCGVPAGVLLYAGDSTACTVTFASGQQLSVVVDVSGSPGNVHLEVGPG